MGGGALVGFEFMISTVLSASSGEVNRKTSVRSRRRSSPGNLSLSALKWLDMVAPLSVVGRIGGAAAGPAWAKARPRRHEMGSAAQEAEQGGVDLVGVGPGDGVRAALDHDEVRVLDQARQAAGGLVQGQDLVGIAVDDQHGHVDLRQVVTEVSGP